MNEHHESWNKISKDIYDYLELKIPDVPKVTKLEIASFLTCMHALTWYDRCNGLERKLRTKE